MVAASVRDIIQDFYFGIFWKLAGPRPIPEA